MANDTTTQRGTGRIKAKAAAVHFPTWKDFIDIENASLFAATLGHVGVRRQPRVTGDPAADLQAISENNRILNLPLRLETAFYALKSNTASLERAKRLRGDALGTIGDAPTTDLPRRRYVYKASDVRLQVMQDMHRKAWTDLSEVLKELVEHLYVFSVTSVKELLQHNMLCAESLLNYSHEVSVGAMGPASVPRDVHLYQGLVTEQFEARLPGLRKLIGVK